MILSQRTEYLQSSKVLKPYKRNINTNCNRRTWRAALDVTRGHRRRCNAPHRTPTWLSHALTSTCTRRITVMFTSSLWDVHVLVWPVDKYVPICLPVGYRLFYTSCSGYTETMRELKQTNVCSHLSMTWLPLSRQQQPQRQSNNNL